MPTRSAKARTGTTNIMEANRATKKASRPAAMQLHFIRKTSSAQGGSTGNFRNSCRDWVRFPSQKLEIAAPTQRKHHTAIFVARQCPERIVLLNSLRGCGEKHRRDSERTY